VTLGLKIVDIREMMMMRTVSRKGQELVVSCAGFLAGWKAEARVETDQWRTVSRKGQEPVVSCAGFLAGWKAEARVETDQWRATEAATGIEGNLREGETGMSLSHPHPPQ
jgi:hypothetical protein